MEPKTRSYDGRTSPAWQAYERAFETYRKRAGIVQALSGISHTDPAVIDSAVLAMEAAREEYQICRDALVRDMLGSAARSEPVDAIPSDEKIREVAGLLWELEGKPQGSELNDWYRAETIIRRAAECAAGC